MGEQAEKAHKIKVFFLLVHLSNPSMRIKGVKEWSGAKKRSYIGLPNKAEYSLSGYKT